VNDTTSVNRIFSGRLSYSKGAYLLHMLRWKLGNDAFYQGLRDYLVDRKYSYARTSDLQSHLEATSGTDLTGFFDDWYRGEGYPAYSVTWDQHDEDLLVKIDQTTSHPSVDFFEMPVPLRLSGGGKDTMIRLEYTFNGQQFSIPVSFDVTTVQFDPDIWLISRDNVVQQGSLVSGIHDLEGNVRITLYPNPAHDVIRVDLLQAQPGEVYHWQIINVLGQRLAAGRLQPGQNEIGISHLVTGLYQFLINDSEGSTVIPLLKE
jgi:hypothetical protein